VPGSLIISGARTPIGKLGGALSTVPAVQLGAVAIAEALRRAGLGPESVGYVVMGQVLMAGQGQNPARQAAARAGVPMGVPSMTVNKVCLSGLQALHLADLMIAAGEAEVVVAGGMESMSGAPYLLEGARAGLRFGDSAMRDVVMADGLVCAFEDVTMGLATDRFAAEHGVGREAQDAVAHRSHERAATAAKSGRAAQETVAVTVPQRRGDAVEVTGDEGVRPETTPERLAALRPAFRPEGTVTAGNSSQVSDGACALVVAAPAAAERLGLQPLAEVVAYGQVAGPDCSLLYQPSAAINDALGRAGLSVGQMEVIEVNEAFAAVVEASARALSVPADMVNPNGGAIALGHPIGASGARLALTLAYELRARPGYGVAALCGGGGQGDSVVLRSVG
jgi:acetyl-CoA C-acetyltransferase